MAAAMESTPADNENDWKDVVHTHPGTLAGRYLRLFWQPVYVAEELTLGRAVPIKIMSEDFTLYRGQSGAPHLLAFRCAHRGTQLSTGWVEGDNLRCFYHGWTYDGSGQCIEQPAEPEPFCQKITIRSYPTEEYLGLIFAYLGERPAPPLPRYLNLETAGVTEAETYVRACNYFQDLENDPVHGAFVHARGRRRSIPVVSAEESEWGMTAYSTYPDGSVRITQWGMPNIHTVHTPPSDRNDEWTETMHWKVPIDDVREASFRVNLVRVTGDAARRYREHRAQVRAQGVRVFAPELSEAILAGKMHVSDIFGRSGIYVVTVEDDVAQIGQGAIADREHEQLGRSDSTVILLRRIWERELRALAEGRPLREWVHTERAVPRDEGGLRRAAMQ